MKLGTAVSAAQAAEAAEVASTVPLHAFALWEIFGGHPPYRIGAPDQRQFLRTIETSLLLQYSSSNSIYTVM